MTTGERVAHAAGVPSAIMAMAPDIELWAKLLGAVYCAMLILKMLAQGVAWLHAWLKADK